MGIARSLALTVLYLILQRVQFLPAEAYALPSNCLICLALRCGHFLHAVVLAKLVQCLSDSFAKIVFIILLCDVSISDPQKLVQCRPSCLKEAFAQLCLYMSCEKKK